MKLIKFLILIILLTTIIPGCDLFNLINSADETNIITYYSKEVEISTDVDPDPDYEDIQSVETRIYDETGKLSIIFKNYYSDPDLLYYFVNVKTEVFEVNDAGVPTLIEYYLYEYVIDDYEYLDDDEVTQSASDYIISRGETYTPDDTLVLYYDVTYVTPLSLTEYDVYETIIDYEAAPLKEIARQESTYITDGYGYERYRTEKFYSLAEPDDATVSLAKEFACWYDSEEPYDYLYELYHSVRSTDASDEFYYLTRYSRDDNGFIYEQADWEYSTAAAPVSPIPILSTATYEDGSYVTPFVYDIEYLDVGGKATVLNTEYDSLGNYIRDNRYLNGNLSEYTTYTYNSNSELIDQSRYTQGGALLYDRVSIQYKDEYRDGVYYRIKERSTFKYNDNDIDWGAQLSKSISRAVSVSDIKQKTNRKITNNYHR